MNKDKLEAAMRQYIKESPLPEERIKELFAFMRTLKFHDFTNMVALTNLKKLEELEDMALKAPTQEAANFMWCCTMMKWENINAKKKRKENAKSMGGGTVQQTKEQVHPPNAQEDEDEEEAGSVRAVPPKHKRRS